MMKNVFNLIVLVMWKNALIRKLRLISKFMTSQPGKQTNAIHTFPNISRTKGNPRMKFGQLLEYNARKIFAKNNAENKGGRLVPELFCVFLKKLFVWLNQMFSTLVSIYFDSPRLGNKIKNNLYN